MASFLFIIAGRVTAHFFLLYGSPLQGRSQKLERFKVQRLLFTGSISTEYEAV